MSQISQWNQRCKAENQNHPTTTSEKRLPEATDKRDSIFDKT